MVGSSSACAASTGTDLGFVGLWSLATHAVTAVPPHQRTPHPFGTHPSGGTLPSNTSLSIGTEIETGGRACAFWHVVGTEVLCLPEKSLHTAALHGVRSVHAHQSAPPHQLQAMPRPCRASAKQHSCGALARASKRLVYWRMVAEFGSGG